jgi:hypothetical protein
VGAGAFGAGALGAGAGVGAAATGAAGGAFCLGDGAFFGVSFGGVTVICGRVSAGGGACPSAEVIAAWISSAELPRDNIQALGARILASRNADQHEERGGSQFTVDSVTRQLSAGRGPGTVKPLALRA